MFWRKEDVPVAVAEAAPSGPPEPQAHEIETLPLDGNEYKAYLTVAKEIGLESSPALVEVDLLRFFKSRRVKLYNYGEVVRHLASKAPEGYSVVWIPLRPRDLELADYVIESTVIKNQHHGIFDKRWQSYNRMYPLAIPLSVIVMVREIEKTIGEKRVQFFVSHYAVPNPDPFIMATTQGMSRLVFGKWNEPDFHGEGIIPSVV